MKPFRPLFAAVAAAGLLAAGCDYWQNLVDEKVVTRTKLDLRVLDIWTKEPLSEAQCKDEARGLEWTPDREGLIFATAMETGHYVISCTSELYYDASVEFSLKPAGASIDIQMARLGGEENWYRDDGARQVSIRSAKIDDPLTVVRFPTTLHLIAGPEDALGRFHYYWKFAKATGLNRDSNSVYLNNNHYRRDAAPPNVAEGLEDTVTLIVKSRLNGIKREYVVDSVQRVFTWVKNQPPVLHLVPMPNVPFRVGCKESVSDVMRVNFAASDTDGGQCVSVRFKGANKNSSLGNVDTTLTGCDDTQMNFYPKDTFPFLSFDSIQVMDDRLLVTVTDDDGGQFDTAIDFKTKSNLQPKLNAHLGNSGNGFTEEKVRVFYDVEDKDGPVQTVKVTWGDIGAQSEANFAEKGMNKITDSASWTYDTPGVKTVTVYTSDYCGDEALPVTKSFIIRDNRKPTVKLEHIRGAGDTAKHIFQVTASDRDINEGLKDAITYIYVDWGDHTADSVSVYSEKTYIEEFEHRFRTPPNAEGKYRIIVYATDAHKGTGVLDTMFLVD